MKKSGRERRWLALYKKAVLEPDPSKLDSRISQAQHAIWKRDCELWYSDVPMTAERRELQTALRFLRLLLAFGKRSEDGAIKSVPDFEVKGRAEQW
ncbi:MAG: hypothetical protein ACM3WP_08125 [Acidobacteriota bacterium]